MRSILSMLRIESRRSVALLLSPLILLAAWWMAYNGMYGTMPGDVYLWQETSRVVKDSILQIGPFVAGLSAWAAGRNRRRGMGDLLSTTPRPAARRNLVTWAGIALPAVAVYGALIFLLGVPTTLEASWGEPLPGYLLIGLVALLMDSALGFAAGCLLPGRFTAPLVAVALWVAHLLPMGAMDYGSGVVLLSPAAGSNMMGADPFYEQARLAPWQIPIFGGLAAAALAAVAVKDQNARRMVSVVLAASLAVCAIGVVAALRAENPYSYSAAQEAASFEYACEEGGITVCIHPAYAKHLPEAARTVNQVAEPLVRISGAPTRALQVNGPKTMPDETESVALFGLFDPWGNLSKESVAFGFVQDETMMYGPNSTREGGFSEEDLRRCGQFEPRKYFDPAEETQVVVGGWLVGRAGGRMVEMSGGCPNSDELVDRFAALDPTERRAWLEKNFAGLRAGKVTLKDLP